MHYLFPCSFPPRGMPCRSLYQSCQHPAPRSGPLFRAFCLLWKHSSPVVFPWWGPSLKHSSHYSQPYNAHYSYDVPSPVFIIPYYLLSTPCPQIWLLNPPEASAVPRVGKGQSGLRGKGGTRGWAIKLVCFFLIILSEAIQLNLGQISTEKAKDLSLQPVLLLGKCWTSVPCHRKARTQ